MKRRYQIDATIKSGIGLKVSEAMSRVRVYKSNEYGTAVTSDVVFNKEATARKAFEVIDASKESAFARARRPNQAHDLSRHDLERDIAKNRVCSEFFDHAFGANHSFSHEATPHEQTSSFVGPAPERPYRAQSASRGSTDRSSGHS